MLLKEPDVHLNFKIKLVGFGKLSIMPGLSKALIVIFFKKLPDTLLKKILLAIIVYNTHINCSQLALSMDFTFILRPHKRIIVKKWISKISMSLTR